MNEKKKKKSCKVLLQEAEEESVFFYYCYCPVHAVEAAVAETRASKNTCYKYGLYKKILCSC